MLIALQINHSAWPAPVRLVSDAIARTLPIEDAGTLDFAPGILAVGTPQIDDTGRAKVRMALGDESRETRNLIASVIGAAERPVITLRWYEDDATLSLGPTRLYLHEPSDDGPSISAEGRSSNDDDLQAQPHTFTLENTPYLRGL